MTELRSRKILDSQTVDVLRFPWPSGSGQVEYVEVWVLGKLISRRPITQLGNLLNEVERLQNDLSEARAALRREIEEQQ